LTDITADVVLRRDRKKRLEQGHPWVFRTEIDRIEGDPAPGALVRIRSHTGHVLGVGYYNPRSQITVRVLSYGELERADAAFFAERFRRCLDYRRRFLPEVRSCRLVYGEADFLPGLIVDRFGDVLVVQLLSLGMDVRRDEIVAALVDVFRPRGIYERSDAPVRELEGLPLRKGPLWGDCPRFVEIEENGLRLLVDIAEGQKTGYFFDQRENRTLLRPIVAGADVLDCFAYTGAFTLSACKYGARRVVCLDVSEQAIELARENVRLNGFTDRVEFVVANAFDFLRARVREFRAAQAGVPSSGGRRPQELQWDVVVLDPPAFAKSRESVDSALRGYKDIHLNALKLVRDGGYLVTSSCSFHVRPDMFLDMALSAAVDARKLLRTVEFRGAGKDHPRILGVEEGDYLKFAIFEVRGR